MSPPTSTPPCQCLYYMYGMYIYTKRVKGGGGGANPLPPGSNACTYMYSCIRLHRYTYNSHTVGIQRILKYCFLMFSCRAWEHGCHLETPWQITSNNCQKKVKNYIYGIFYLQEKTQKTITSIAHCLKKKSTMVLNVVQSNIY